MKPPEIESWRFFYGKQKKIKTVKIILAVFVL
jgi:hypothetical protein